MLNVCQAMVFIIARVAREDHMGWHQLAKTDLFELCSCQECLYLYIYKAW